MSPELEAALERAREWDRAASPEEKAAMFALQRESWARGEAALGSTDGCGTTYLRAAVDIAVTGQPARARAFNPADLTAAKCAALPGLHVRIWSGEHGAYWRYPANGYTGRVPEAGIYPIAEAWQRTKHCGPEKRIELEEVLS